MPPFLQNGSNKNMAPDSNYSTINFESLSFDPFSTEQLINSKDLDPDINFYKNSEYFSSLTTSYYTPKQHRYTSTKNWKKHFNKIKILST